MQYFVCLFLAGKLCRTICDPMDCSMPGLVHHQLPEITQTHVHWVGDAIQPFHPVIPFSFHLQSFPASGIFKWVSSSHKVESIGAIALASVLSMNIQSWFLLGLTSLIFLQSKGLSSVFSSSTIRRHQFFGAQPSLWSNSHICTWLLEKP